MIPNKLKILLFVTVLSLTLNPNGLAAVDVGDQAIQFELKDVNDVTYSLQDSSHKIIVLFFIGYS